MERRLLKKSNERGAVLLTVLCVMTIMMILVGAAVSFVNITSDRTYKTFQSEQAYMTASTCLESFVNQIEREEKLAVGATEAEKLEVEKNIKKLQNLAKTGATGHFEYKNNSEIGKMGTCDIKIENYTSDQSIIVVTATAKFGKEEETVAAYIYTPTTKKKCTFDNAIEIAGTQDTTFDNLHVLGDMATISSSSNDASRNNKLKNNCEVYGKSVWYGNFENTVQSTMTLYPSLSDPSGGGYVIISNNLNVTSNDFRVKSTQIRQDGYNYVNVGGTVNVTNKLHVGSVVGKSEGDIPNVVKTATNTADNQRYDVDLYCRNLNFGTGCNGSDFVGNIYVYKDSPSDLGGGNLVVNNGAAHVVVYGDIYCEGDLKVTSGSLNVHGDVYVAGSITGTVTCWGTKTNGATTTNNTTHPDATINKTGRGERPEIPVTLNEYVYFPEDMLMSDDTVISGHIKDDYKKFYATGASQNTKTLTSFLNTSKEVSLTVGGVTSKYVVEITDSCTFEKNDIQNLKNAAGGPPKILVHVKNKNIVIRLKSDLSDAGDSSMSFLFVVYNESEKTENKEKFCYFVSDSGVSGSCGTMVDGKSTHDDNWNKPTYSFCSSGILSYDTYAALFPSKLASKSGDIQGWTAEGKLNLTKNDITGSYNPPDGQIVVLLTHDCTWKVTNNSFWDCTVYAPEAKFFLATNGIKFPAKTIYMDSATNPIEKEIMLVNLGVVVCDHFLNQVDDTGIPEANSVYYSYNMPSENSVLAFARGARSDTLLGYQLLRYDHH